MEKQRNRVVQFYRENGYISRNYFFNDYPAITRLGAVIYALNKIGWNLEGRWVKAQNKPKDFVYRQKDDWARLESQPPQIQPFQVSQSTFDRGFTKALNYFEGL